MALIDPLAYAQYLIAQKSITPECCGIHERIAQDLAPLGFASQLFDRAQVSNIWLENPGLSGQTLCFVGHTDVVPPGAQWDSPPFEPQIRDAYLYGRGASDMKGAIAAFIAALSRFYAANTQRQLGVCVALTSDEEGPATDGTVVMVEHWQQQQRQLQYVVVGEPTAEERVGDTVKIGRRGSLSARVSIHGIQGHIAYPNGIQNPVTLAAPMLVELSQTVWDQAHGGFPATTWQVSNINAGIGVGNVTPAVLTWDCNFRFSPQSTVESLQQRFENIIRKHHDRYHIEWTLSARPFVGPRAQLWQWALQAVEQHQHFIPETSTSGGTSDGRFMIDICEQIIELGLVRKGIHKVNERVAVADLYTLTDIYTTLLESIDRELTQHRG